MARLNLIRLAPDSTPAARAIAAGLGMGLVVGIADVWLIPALILGGRFQRCIWSPGATCDYLQLAVTIPPAGVITGTVLAASRSLSRPIWLGIAICSIAYVPLVAAVALANVETRTHWQLADTWWLAGLSIGMGILVALPRNKRGSPTPR